MKLDLVFRQSDIDWLNFPIKVWLILNHDIDHMQSEESKMNEDERRLLGRQSVATNLTDKILGHNSDDLVRILKAIASEVGLSHISFVRFSSNRTWDVSLMTSVATYSKAWQVRYFLKRYGAIDPVIKHGSAAIRPFDWDTLHSDDPATQNFFADAKRHRVGCNGLSIPVRNRKNTLSLISFDGDLPREEWEAFKELNMTYLQQLSALIDSAAGIDSKPPPSSVQLSPREEQCLIWAERGKTHQEIADILSLSLWSVKTHLDTARHKLRCINLTHAVGIAVATGVIPAAALRDRSSFND
jgi:LuxR family transcriptional regulator, quorum-sensing system regulator SinR